MWYPPAACFVRAVASATLTGNLVFRGGDEFRRVVDYDPDGIRRLLDFPRMTAS
jgi:hypothetical protein